MMTSYIRQVAAVIAMFALVACENLPGSRTEQATGVGAAAGAAVGAAASDNELMGLLLGGAAGAAGGYLIGARTDWFEQDGESRSAAARESLEEARESPATAAEAEEADSADINEDGFVTMDELIALEEADFDEDEILDRLERTDQVFELSAEQEDELVDEGLSRDLVAEIERVNREERERVLDDDDVISRRAS